MVLRHGPWLADAAIERCRSTAVVACLTLLLALLSCEDSTAPDADNSIASGWSFGECGGFLGVTLSLVALQHTETGVAASIFACFPLPALFLGARFHREVVSLRTVAGAGLAIGGVIVLFAR